MSSFLPNLNSTPQQNFRQVRLQNICRQQNNCSSKIDIFGGKDRKHSGKRRKSWLPGLSLFPTIL